MADTKTACRRCLPEHSIAESTQTGSTLFKQLFPGPCVIRYRVDGIPARRIGGYICSNSAVFMARNYYNPGEVLRAKAKTAELDRLGEMKIKTKNKNLTPWREN